MADQTEGPADDVASAQRDRRHWGVAIGTGLACGLLFALAVGDGIPVPVPGEATPLFWLGWGPTTAVGILVFVAAVAPGHDRLRWCGAAAAAAIVAGVACGVSAWGRTDDAASLIALHLPFVCWSVVGAGLTLGHEDRARNFYGFIVKSMEALATGAIYLGAGALFGGLTVGIFAVLGIELSPDLLRHVAAFGIGTVPVLAVASVYDPARAPVQQEATTGVARILRIMAWLLLPLALAVLAIYVAWFIPTHFWRGFEDREVLIVYNATIIAIFALLAAAVSEASAVRGQGHGRVLRPAVLSLAALTLLLNAYALAAVVGRTMGEFGLTPNRHAVLGWNVVTLLMLAHILWTSSSSSTDDRLPTIRASLARTMVLPAAWACWVVWGLPLL